MKQIYLFCFGITMALGANGVHIVEENNPSQPEGCDANSGTSPGDVFICSPETFNLFDLLIAPVDGGGVWNGPPNWSGNGTSNGTFDPATDTFGTFAYSVEGIEGCVSTTSIEVVLNDAGFLGYGSNCTDELTDLQ